MIEIFLSVTVMEVTLWFRLEFFILAVRRQQERGVGVVMSRQHREEREDLLSLQFYTEDKIICGNSV